MKKIAFLLILFVGFSSCKTKSRVVTTKSEAYKKPTYNPKSTTSSTTKSTASYGSTKADQIIKKALSYKGTKYKYGGSTKSGMDCSGLMVTSFQSQKIVLPRRSIDQSKKGIKISVSKIQKGDLVFFNTGNGNSINHVGLVIDAKKEVRFIHSSTSRGVMVSSLKEGYWSKVFKEARRIL